MFAGAGCSKSGAHAAGGDIRARAHASAITARLDALERRLGIYDCERPNSLVHFKSYLK
jgi:hypothetical protein